MKTLLFKAAKEILKPALAGALGMVAMLVMNFQGFSTTLEAVMRGETNLRFPLQPLRGQEFQQYLMFFCVLFGAALGWLQTRSESSPGLWGFLVHRPATKTRLFLAKVICGAGMYALATGVPLGVYILWIVTPGNVAAPWDIRMLMPVAIFWLLGFPFYFAMLLAGFRRARWYVSRLVPAGAAVVVIGVAFYVPDFWQAVLVILGSSILLALGAKASFAAGGIHEGDAASASPVMGLLLALGWGVAVFFAGAMLGDVLGRFCGGREWSYHVVENDGAIRKVARSPGGATRIMDSNGKTVIEPRSGLPLPLSELQPRLAHSSSLHSRPSVPPDRLNWMRQSYACAWQYRATPESIWFFLPDYGRLAGYSTAARKFIGSLGPDGFSTSLKGSGERFSEAAKDWFTRSNLLVKVDVYTRTVETFFTATEGAILTTGHLETPQGCYALAATANRVYIIHPDGQTVWSTPNDSGSPGYDTIRIHKLNEPGRFSIWFVPNFFTNRTAGFKLPIKVREIQDEQQHARPDLPVLNGAPGLQDEAEPLALAITMPPVSIELVRWVSGDQTHSGWMRWRLISAATAVLVALPIGLWWMRRYRLSPRTQLAWGLFLAIGGFPALLALVTVRSWPRRVPCGGCGRLRSIEREFCEHCGAAFPPPQRFGIELFENEPAGRRMA